MDDSQAILAELDRMIFDVCVKAWESKAQYVQNLRNEICADIDTITEFIKRRYETAGPLSAGVVTQPVTRMSFEEWNKSEPVQGNDTGRILAAENSRRKGWNAALANVQPVETGKRFEVGDKVSMLIRNSEWVDGTIVATHVDRVGTRHSTPHTSDVRPLPKTVDLTDDEKIEAIVDAVCKSLEAVRNGAVATLEGYKMIAVALATGKTLDQLCNEYSIAIMRSE